MLPYIAKTEHAHYAIDRKVTVQLHVTSFVMLEALFTLTQFAH